MLAHIYILKIAQTDDHKKRKKKKTNEVMNNTY